jgi:hypothetical protein
MTTRFLARLRARTEENGQAASFGQKKRPVTREGDAGLFCYTADIQSFLCYSDD